MDGNYKMASDSKDIKSESVKRFEALFEASGYNSVDQLILDLARHFGGKIPSKYEFIWSKQNPLQQIYKTKKGKILQGNSLHWLLNPRNRDKVDLIVTSPPFGLITKKKYGNESAKDYCDWFKNFAAGFVNVLKHEGSLVIDIAGSWEKGSPTRNLYQFEVLLMLCKEYKFNLCQEHYWWNPSKLPSPIQWTNVERSRVKDSINCVWWLSKSKKPKASNLNILGSYSKSMNSVLKNGLHTGVRPSGHRVTNGFLKDNVGAIPPNLLAIANSDSKSGYFEYCKRMGLPSHPARFPEALPEYFIRFLTDKNDLVVDPFGGSSVTGYVAENLERRWRSIELDERYALGGIGRFESPQPYKSFSAKYEISSPFQANIEEK